jgi:hypothetical protein
MSGGRLILTFVGVTVDQIRSVARSLPRASEHLIRDRVKFRVGSIVFVALSADETSMGFGYPKHERAALVAAEPAKFMMPIPSDERYHWVRARLGALDFAEMRELVEEAWRMVVPKSVAAQHLGLPTPDLASLRAIGVAFAGLGNVDRTWFKLMADTAPGLDLSNPEHRPLALTWLNTWGCRLPYRGTFDASAAAWALTWPSPSLPSAPIETLADADILTLAGAYESLATLSIGKRTLGPTAGAKLLYALRPISVMPWDAAIAAHLHGARDKASFAKHLHLGRTWAQSLLAETSLTADDIAAKSGRPGISLAKVLDEYTYMLITRASR